MTTSPSTRTVLAVDPGSVKCGIALVTGPPPVVISRAIVAAIQLVPEVGLRLRAHPEIASLIIGSGTQSRTLMRVLRDTFPTLKVEVVDERGSSQRARRRYCQEVPARGWRKLLPAGMRVPEEPYDDWVAVLLAEEYLTAAGGE